jgi:ferric-dicitrate binding protein FerR (iron transport regulator)
LAAGDRGSLGGDGHVQTFPNSVQSDDAAWTTGRVVFHDAPLARVAAELHRWYGVELHADSALLQQHVTTTFENGDSIDQILKNLGLMLGARVDREGDSATIQSIRGSAPVR